MKNRLTFNRIVFILNLVLCTFIGGLMYQNIVDKNYIWIIGDFIILVMLYVSTYFYAQHIDKE